MLITQTPLRVSIGGGGTDLPSYYSIYGGFVISAAISKYIFIAASRKWEPGYLIKYSQTEDVGEAAELRHPIFREVLSRHRLHENLEIASLADVPAGTGLGSSGSFTVGLLKAAYAIQGIERTDAEIAEEACSIEIDILQRPVGKQDQYIAAMGGLQCFTFSPDGTVVARPLEIPVSARKELDERLLMFFTGFTRQASELLEDQRKRSCDADPKMLENLHFTKQLGYASREYLEAGRLDCYGSVLREHWKHKRVRSSGTSNDRINRWHDTGLENGAVGGKLVGAGGGGFLLFLAEDPARLRRAMAEEGLKELSFNFTDQGSSTIISSTVMKDERLCCSV
jgi:D-glycero-alpha-D-manno-heptose-7-phosphate kinase